MRLESESVDAVGDKVEIHLDGGIRSGQAILKSMCLDAKGTYVGRPYLYGLGAMGKKGVSKMIEILHKELDVTMALCGERRVADLSHSNIYSAFGDRYN